MSSLGSLVRVGLDLNAFLEFPSRSQGLVVVEVELNLFLFNLRVVDGDLGALSKKVLGDVHGGGLTSISSILFEGESKEGDLLTRDGVEHGLDHLPGEAVLLVVVDLDNLVPVLRDLLKTEALAEVHKVQDILLEARSTEADGGVKEALANTLILTDSVSNFLDISASGFAKLRDGVDRGDTLSKEGVSNELGELRRPEVGGDNPIPGDPVGVHINKLLHSLLSKLGGHASNEYTVRHIKVFHSGTLGKELRIRKHLEVDLAIVSHQHLTHRVRGTDGESGFLNNDLRSIRNLGDVACCKLPVLQIRGAACTNTVGLGWSIDRDKDDLAFLNRFIDLRGEEQVLVANLLDYRVEPRLVDRQCVGVPSRDLLWVDVDDVHLHVRTLESNCSHGWTPNISGTNATDLGLEVGRHRSELSSCADWGWMSRSWFG
mmetsp:Transcript_24272/g.47395  ORF Transcript_24272/g.47395 Transcript_24272/m.47395 type:complete len:431 (-) Transcript_24272:11-1303(-)